MRQITSYRRLPHLGARGVHARQRIGGDVVRAAEREAALQAMEDLLVPLSESDADKTLRAGGSDRITPNNWGMQPEPVKRGQIRRLLKDAPDELLAELLEFLPVSVRRRIMQSDKDSEAIVQAERAFDGPIFVVHGHALGAMHETVRVLERGTGREVIVLHEQANAGRTILEKFEDYAGHASFAVVLLTGDDEGGARTGTDKHLRGRQNVIFELGFFFGKLGRQRVVVLIEENVERPSDIDGLVYINRDQAGAWKQALARELEAASISVDRSRIP